VREAVVVIEQVQQAGLPTFRMPLELELETASGRERRKVEMSERRTVVRVPLAAAPTAVRLDPDGWLLKELAPPGARGR
jgi:hypothetical protein